ncbi:MAG TPA: F0F1 ATP synthase subunit B [Lacipirellulaceae bacterium]|nr:F0F1 ATP synthase subunit B [Lacipirellulaceae bacterium]
MSVFTRLGPWFAALALIVALLTARSVFAQPETPEAQEAAGQSAEHDAHEVEPAGDPNPLAFRTDLAFWTLIVFLVLFGLLSVFAWPQIATALDEREKKITDSIAAAEAKHEEAKQLLAQHEAKLAAAAGEVRALLEEARRDAEHTRRSIAAKGDQDAKAALERALREIDRAKDGAILDLATTSAKIAIELAGKVVREKLSQDEQNNLVREALVKLTAMNPSEN